MERLDQIWEDIDKAQKVYEALHLSDAVDYGKFFLYSLVTQSSAIEGSTLTELDTQLLLDEGITAKGKSLIHHLMNEDLKNAYTFAAQKAKEKTPLSPGLLKEMNALVMRRTGNIHSTMGREFDSGKGDYRLCGVTAGYGGKSYVNYQKVPERVSGLCGELNVRLKDNLATRDIYHLSFDAHLNLATIHPWIDGNGRTARLLMNYIQYYYKVIPTKVFHEDRAPYIASLIESREKESNLPFREFMASEHLKMLKKEVEGYRQSNSRGMNFLF